MEAPPERRRDQGVQRCAKGPVSLIGYERIRSLTD